MYIYTHSPLGDELMVRRAKIAKPRLPWLPFAMSYILNLMATSALKFFGENVMFTCIKLILKTA